MDFNKRRTRNTKYTMDVYADFHLHFGTGAISLRGNLMYMELTWQKKKKNGKGGIRKTNLYIVAAAFLAGITSY